MEFRDEIIRKNESKIDNYLESFRIAKPDNLQEKCYAVLRNVEQQISDFEAKNPTYKKIKGSDKYFKDLENYLEKQDSEAGFEGFEDEDFAPIALGVGKKLLQGGAKLIKAKIEKGLGSKKVQKIDDADAVKLQTAKPNEIAHEKVKYNVLDAGADVWLDKAKKEKIDNLLKEKAKKDFTTEVKRSLIEIGKNPKDFEKFEDADGNYSYSGGKKIKDILGGVFEQVKEGETAKEYNKAMPKIFLAVIVALILGVIIGKKI